MMKRVSLFAKGMCMGIADVIPGVSGGTLALVLGIYTEFVETIKGLHLSWLPLLWRFIKGGRQEQDRAALIASLQTLNLGFLITLVSGIATAIVVGSMTIPYLMENYPVATRAFFFGLIVASVYVPMRMIREQHKGSSTLVMAAVLAVVCAVGGYALTNPSNQFQAATTWKQATSSKETLKELTRREPSAMTVEQIYWHENNQALRDAVAREDAKAASSLEALRAQAGKVIMDKKALKARSEPYQAVVVPEGVVVEIPQPALWFVFISGAVAICAMILPGISGSYILLIFGVYFFILNALKGLPVMLLKGQLPTTHIMYVGSFVVAMVVGILSFSRVLSYLLKHHAAPTLGALVGLMVGCLRGIWPFRDTVEGVPVNILPTGQTPSLGAAVATCLLGVAIVVGLSLLGSRAIDGAGEAAAQD